MTKPRFPKLSCDKHKDPVERLVRDCTAKEMVDWMIKHHGLPKGSAETVRSNLDQQFRHHNLRGRLQAGALTAEQLSAGLDAFWNAATQAVHHGNDQETAMPVISAIAQGLAAVAAELRKGDAA